MRYVVAEFMANYEDTEKQLSRIGPLEVTVADDRVNLTFHLRGREEDYVTITVSYRDLLAAIVEELPAPHNDN